MKFQCIKVPLHLKNHAMEMTAEVLVRLTAVTLTARGDQVVWLIASADTNGDDVVDIQNDIRGLPPAILARHFIPLQDIKAHSRGD